MTAPPDTAWPGAALRAAFRATRYGPPGSRVTLTGEGPGLPGALPDWTAGRWAVVTAWNPWGQRQSRARNEGAHGHLLARAAAWAIASVGSGTVGGTGASGRSVLAAVNGDGEWREPSVVLRGHSLREAARLGRTFRQAAVLYGCGGRAALVWLPPGADRMGAVWVERLWLRPVPAGQDVY